MRLLFDQNLSPRLVQRLADCFPDSAHVQSFDMDKANDDKVLAFDESNGFALVSKDSDFFDPALLRGKAAKIVWIRGGIARRRKSRQSCAAISPISKIWGKPTACFS